MNAFLQQERWSDYYKGKIVWFYLLSEGVHLVTETLVRGVNAIV